MKTKKRRYSKKRRTSKRRRIGSLKRPNWPNHYPTRGLKTRRSNTLKREALERNYKISKQVSTKIDELENDTIEVLFREKDFSKFTDKQKKDRMKQIYADLLITAMNNEFKNKALEHEFYFQENICRNTIELVNCRKLFRQKLNKYLESKVGKINKKLKKNYKKKENKFKFYTKFDLYILGQREQSGVTKLIEIYKDILIKINPESQKGVEELPNDIFMTSSDPKILAMNLINEILVLQDQLLKIKLFRNEIDQDNYNTLQKKKVEMETLQERYQSKKEFEQMEEDLGKQFLEYIRWHDNRINGKIYENNQPPPMFRHIYEDNRHIYENNLSIPPPIYKGEKTQKIREAFYNRLQKIDKDNLISLTPQQLQNINSYIDEYKINKIQNVNRAADNYYNDQIQQSMRYNNEKSVRL